MTVKIDLTKGLFHEALGLDQNRVNQLAIIMDNYFASKLKVGEIAERIQSTETYTQKERLYLNFLMGYMYKTLVNRMQAQKFMDEQKQKQQEGEKDNA